MGGEALDCLVSESRHQPLINRQRQRRRRQTSKSRHACDRTGRLRWIMWDLLTSCTISALMARHREAQLCGGDLRLATKLAAPSEFVDSCLAVWAIVSRHKLQPGLLKRGAKRRNKSLEKIRARNQHAWDAVVTGARRRNSRFMSITRNSVDLSTLRLCGGAATRSPQEPGSCAYKRPNIADTKEHVGSNYKVELALALFEAALIAINQPAPQYREDVLRSRPTPTRAEAERRDCLFCGT
mmetsp:Transcript_5183/g.15833  ORF Transcript_5183/g.15833 Transcript_5183/m.15833 type:complete len:240 (+) Transcript_5183:569-1288(+)